MCYSDDHNLAAMQFYVNTKRSYVFAICLYRMVAGDRGLGPACQCGSDGSPGGHQRVWQVYHSAAYTALLRPSGGTGRCQISGRMAIREGQVGVISAAAWLSGRDR